MTLGSIGEGVEKLDRKRKDSKIMFITEQMTTVGTWSQSTGNLGDSLQNTSQLFSPYFPHRDQGDGEFILGFPSIIG